MVDRFVVCLTNFLSRSEDDKLSGPSLPEGRKEEEEGLLMDNPVAQRGGKKGKKDRKKKGFDDDWYNFYLIRPAKVYLINTLSLM